MFLSDYYLSTATDILLCITCILVDLYLLGKFIVFWNNSKDEEKNKKRYKSDNDNK